jgi:hypothetical protein
VRGRDGHAGDTGGQTPVYDAFFAGGFSSLRGFEFRGAGPHANSVLVGGDFEVLAGAEYLFPITADDSLRGVLLLDTGTVEPSIKDMEHYRVVPGFGLRITIPTMGPAPIALDFAFSDCSGWEVSRNVDQSAERQKRNNSLQGVGGWYTTRHSTDREARPDPVFDCRQGALRGWPCASAVPIAITRSRWSMPTPSPTFLVPIVAAISA